MLLTGIYIEIDAIAGIGADLAQQLNPALKNLVHMAVPDGM